ncbi:MAG TPA: UbiA prenyltransferase family protein [Puia sp.]|jgi:4-hydroxybenzoate polyprenyltransferase
MKYYLQLLRPRDWAKNLFLIVPSFFAGQFFVRFHFFHLMEGIVSFCFIASAIYIINDYRDIEDDRKHPVKCHRPLASGTVKKPVAVGICIGLILMGSVLGWMADSHYQFLFILALYFFINLFYSFGLKNFAILDILMLSSGFVLRVKGGAIISRVEASEWLIIMTFLLSLFMAIAKRRDDLLLKLTTGTDMRKSMRGYNLDFLNTMLGLSSAIVIVAYINYTVSPVTVERLGTHRLYYSSLFVIAGLLRYLQITFVLKKSGSPTEILYKDHFIQITLALWIISIYVILYLRDITIFSS